MILLARDAPIAGAGDMQDETLLYQLIIARKIGSYEGLFFESKVNDCLR